MFQELLDSDYNRRKFIMCRDEAGVTLLHKAVFYDFMDIAAWLVKECPELVHQKDSVSYYKAQLGGKRVKCWNAALLEGAERGGPHAGLTLVLYWPNFTIFPWPSMGRWRVAQ